MRIVDLLSKDSILLNASPKNKAFWQEKKTARPPLAKALPSRTQRMQP